MWQEGNRVWPRQYRSHWHELSPLDRHGRSWSALSNWLTSRIILWIKVRLENLTLTLSYSRNSPHATDPMGHNTMFTAPYADSAECSVRHPPPPGPIFSSFVLTWRTVFQTTNFSAHIQTKTLYAFLFSPITARWPRLSQPPSSDHSNILYGRVKIKARGYLKRYSDSLWGGRLGDRIPVGARFFAPLQFGPGAYTAPTQWVSGKRPRCGAKHPPHLALRLKKE